MSECAYINRILDIPGVLKYGRVENASVTQHSEYTGICLDIVLIISWVLNMPEF